MHVKKGIKEYLFYLSKLLFIYFNLSLFIYGNKKSYFSLLALLLFFVVYSISDYFYSFKRFEQFKLRFAKTIFSFIFASFILIGLQKINILSLTDNQFYTISFANLFTHLLLLALFYRTRIKRYNIIIVTNRFEEFLSKVVKTFGDHIGSINLISDFKKIDKTTKYDYYIFDKDNFDIEIFEYQAIFDNKNLIILPALSRHLLDSYHKFLIDDEISLLRLPINKFQLLLKRFIDITLSIGLFAVFLPLFIVITITLKLFQKGPVFYFQERMTVNGATFKLVKFRTMIENAEEETGIVLASKNDKRITPVGKFLRKTKLDELPQLINIIKGEMSFVGPRPERPFLIEEFTNAEPLYKERFKVKAGLTGLSQINSYYDSDFLDKLSLDLIYINNFSIIFDIKIILNTVLVFFKSSFKDDINDPFYLEGLLKENNLKIKSYSENSIIIKRNDNR